MKKLLLVIALYSLSACYESLASQTPSPVIGNFVSNVLPNITNRSALMSALSTAGDKITTGVTTITKHAGTDQMPTMAGGAKGLLGMCILGLQKTTEAMDRHPAITGVCSAITVGALLSWVKYRWYDKPQIERRKELDTARDIRNRVRETNGIKILEIIKENHPRIQFHLTPLGQNNDQALIEKHKQTVEKIVKDIGNTQNYTNPVMAQALHDSLQSFLSYTNGQMNIANVSLTPLIKKIATTLTQMPELVALSKQDVHYQMSADELKNLYIAIVKSKPITDELHKLFYMSAENLSEEDIHKQTPYQKFGWQPLTSAWAYICEKFAAISPLQITKKVTQAPASTHSSTTKQIPTSTTKLEIEDFATQAIRDNEQSAHPQAIGFNFKWLSWLAPKFNFN